MAKYSIPDLTPQEQRLLDSGAYTEEEILQRRGSVAKSNWGWATQEEAPVAPPVQEPAPPPAQDAGGFWNYMSNKAGAATDTMQAGLQRIGADLFGQRAPDNWNPVPIQLEADRQSNRAEALSQEQAAQKYLNTVEGPFDKWALQTAGDVAGSWPSAIPLVTAGAGGLLAATTGRVAGGAIGALAPTAMKWLTQYEEGRDHLPPEEAAARATETIPSEYIGEALGALGPVKGGYAARVGLRGLWEAGGETATEVMDIGYDVAKRDLGPKEFQQAYAQMAPKDFQEAASRISRAASAGLLMGGGVGILSEIGTGKSKEEKPKGPPAFLSGQEAANELERIARENDSKKPKIEDDVELANSFVSLDLDDISKMPQFTMDMKGHKFKDYNMVQPTPTETKATPQNPVDELQRQAKEEQLRNMGLPRLPEALWEGGRQTEPVMPGPFQTQNAEPALQPDPLTGQAPAIPEMTFNNEFRPPSQLQGREVLGLKNYDERTGVGTGPVGPASAPTEAPVQPQGMPEEPSMYQQSYTMPPFKQGYDLKLGKDKGKAAPKATPAEEIKSLINSLNNKPKASGVSNDLPVLERQEDTNTFERIIRSQVQNASQLARVFSGMASTPRAKSMIQALLGAKFLDKVEVRIADSEQDRILLQTIGEQGARGAFIPKALDPGKWGAGVILLAPSNWGPTKHGMSPDITYHEVGHAVTHTLLDMAERGVKTTPEIEDLVNQLEDIRQEIISQAPNIARNDMEIDILNAAVQDLHELVSYSLTNRTFSQVTSRIRTKGQTIGQRIKALLTRLATAFGMDFKDANNLMDILFDRALATVKETSKFDPTEITESHTINRETGRLGRAAVNKSTRKRLGSEVTTKPPVLYSQLQNLIDSSGGAGNATLDKWYSWLDTMVSNKRVKLEEAEAFKRYLEREKELKQSSFVTARAMKEHASGFNDSIGIFSQGPVRIASKNKTKGDPATLKVRVQNLLDYLDTDYHRFDTARTQNDFLESTAPELIDIVDNVKEKYHEKLTAAKTETERWQEEIDKEWGAALGTIAVIERQEKALNAAQKVKDAALNAAMRAARSANWNVNFRNEINSIVKKLSTKIDLDHDFLNNWVEAIIQHIYAKERVADIVVNSNKEIFNKIKKLLEANSAEFAQRASNHKTQLIDRIHSIIGNNKNEGQAHYENYSLSGGKDYGMIGLQDKGKSRSPTAGKEQIHTGKSNVIGWARFKTRGNGLAIEEIQSDWNQQHSSPNTTSNIVIEYKQDGIASIKETIKDYKQRIANIIAEWGEVRGRNIAQSYIEAISSAEEALAKEEKALEDLKKKRADKAPAMSKEWVTNVLKPVIAEAVYRGLSYVSFTKGEVQAERYDMPNSNIPAQYDNWFKQEINNYVKKFGSKVVDGADPKAHNWDGGEVAKRFWVFEITPEMQETVLTKGQPRFVKRDDTGKVVDEVAERRNRLQPDTTEVVEGEEIVLQNEDQPEELTKRISKSKLDSNMDDLAKGLLRDGFSTQVPAESKTGLIMPDAFLEYSGKPVNPKSIYRQDRPAANDPGTGPKPAAAKTPEDISEEVSPSDPFARRRKESFASSKEAQDQDAKHTRRGFLTMMAGFLGAAAGITNYSRTDGLTLGKAKPISPDVLGKEVGPEVAKLLRSSNPGSLKAAIEKLAVEGPQELRSLLIEVANLLPKDVVVRVDDYNDGNAHGETVFDGNVPVVTLYTAGNARGLSLATVIHEALHAVVMGKYAALNIAAISNNYRLLGVPNAKEQIAAFKKLFEEFASFGHVEAIKLKAANGEKLTELDLSLYEASRDPDEFFVRALTSAPFQEYLSKQEYKGKSLLERFANWVKVSLFGKRQGTIPSWLDAALLASNELLTASKQDASDNSWATKITTSTQNQIKSLKQETFAKGEIPSKMPLEGRGPDWSPAGILKNIIWSLFKPSTAAFVNMDATLQHFEEMKQRRGVEFYRIQQALNVMAASNDQANVMAAVEGDQAALKKLNADDAQAVSTFMINMDMLQRELFLKYLQGIKHPTEKDVAVAKKAAESILGPDKYRHRAYAADIKKGGIGVKWVSDVLRNKDKPGSLWQKAKEALIRDEFTLPQDINKLKPYEVERAYTHWTLLSPEGKTQQEMKASLEKFKQVNQEGIARRADQLIEVILRLAPSPGQSVSRLYSGGKLDTSIVTPRTKISPEIRALKGEITDPLARLVVTSTRLIDFVAKASFLHNVYEMGKSGGWVFDAADPNVSPQATVAIEGKEFGPFDGTRVTPNLKAILDTAIEVTQSVEFGAQNNIFGALKSGSKNLLRYWNKAVITPIKVVTLIGNHAVWAMNLIGGPTTLLSNGNLTGRGVPSVVANSLALTNITKHKKWNAFVDDAIKHGTMDSPIFGELYNEQLRDFSSAVANAVFTEKNWRNTVRKKVLALTDKVSSSKDRVRNWFALMDMGYKLANGINEYTQLRAAYPDWTEEQVWKVASNRTKMGNYTRDRAMPLAKGVDYPGAQMFAVYITEIPRTLIANLLIGTNDVIEGAKTKNSTLITHGMKRLSGVGLATVALKQILTSIAAVAGLTVLGSEDDEERKRKAEAIRRALPDDYQNAILAPTAVNKDGVLTLQAIDRADFHGAWNSVFRAAAKVAAGEEPPEFLSNELSNLMYMHSVFGALFNQKKGWFGRENPEAYETTFKKLTTDLGLFSLSPENANRLINTGSLLIPKTLTRTILPAIRNMGKAEEDKEPVYWTGFKPIEYDPKRELMFSLDAYNGALNGGKSELGRIIAGTGTKMDKAGLEIVYNRAIADELEAFDRVYRKINGARAMGFDDQQIAQMLVLGKMRRDYIPYVMNGQFIPRPFGERYLESAMVDNAFSNETPKRKEEIQKKLAEAKVYLEQLRGEYVHGRLN